MLIEIWWLILETQGILRYTGWKNAEILLLKLILLAGLKGAMNWILDIIQPNICEHSYPELIDSILS
jgi:hypothetical protein